MLPQDQNDDFGIDVLILMHDDVAKFGHFLHDVRYLWRDKTSLRQAFECIGITGWHPQPAVRNDVAGDKVLSTKGKPPVQDGLFQDGKIKIFPENA